MDASDCETCGLRWEREERHPPCLKLSPDERRAIGATAASQVAIDEVVDEVAS